MVFFNYTTMQVTAKIVYYGPGLCGKTTNLQHIHQKTAGQSRGEMISLETETDRTLFFDLLPLDVGMIGGMKVRLQLYTVPGQVFYNATRKLVLKGADGIVFVADSQVSMLDSNVESLRNLAENVQELGLRLGDIPMVFQYNKRDIRNIQPVEALNEVLNPQGATYFEAAALHGIGVFETLKSISRVALTSVRKRLSEDRRSGRPGVHPLAPAALGAATVAAAAALEPSADPLAQLVEGLSETPSPADEVKVEFAEEDTGKHMRAVPTRGLLDIQEELEKLRTLTAPAARAATAATARDVERRLQDMLISERETRQEVKRKVAVEIPAHLLKGSSELRIHVGFEGEDGEEVVRDAVTIKLAGNRRLERLALHLDLELKSKS